SGEDEEELIEGEEVELVKGKGASFVSERISMKIGGWNIGGWRLFEDMWLLADWRLFEDR
ncbi:hypothetical protein BVRB_4g076500, partial [Beta vulgaris subsp. vulgaris]